MTFKHGVYTAEIATSISAAPPSDSALPYIVGTSSKGPTSPVVIDSWEAFKESYGSDELSEGFHAHSLVSFADFWFRRMGRGRAIFCSVGTEVNKEALIAGVEKIDSIYSRFRLVPTLLLCPYYNVIAEIRAAMISKAESFGGGKWACLALIDAPSRSIELGDDSVAAITDSKQLAAWKTNANSAHAAIHWPLAGLGSKRYDLSTVNAAAIARTDEQNGNFPYVSSSNKQAGIDGIYTRGSSEAPVFLSEQQINDDLNANGIVGAINSAAGWVIWGNWTSAFPGSTDIKDAQIPVRRMFDYIKSMFLRHCSGRVDLPLNKRQLDGIINSFNQQLQGLKGAGAVNSASVTLAESNGPENLLSGLVRVHIKISPPPAMAAIEGVIEYDVQGFVESLA